MTIYNFNKGIGWASSGVEYAQAYRSNIFKKNKQKAKFIFTDMFQENLQPMAQNIGFEDDEIIWLYQSFTDVRISPTTFSVKDLEKEITFTIKEKKTSTNSVTYISEENGIRLTAYLDKVATDKVYKTELLVNGKLIQRDYYTYVKTFSEYFKPVDNSARLFQRRFFNANGSVAYEELLNGKDSLFLFENRIIFSKRVLLEEFIKNLQLTAQDILIIDRSTDQGPEIIKCKGPAKVGSIVHAEHYNATLTTPEKILWNNFYEYSFTNVESFDFYVTATEKQKNILAQQFNDYKKADPLVEAIPVGSLDRLRKKAGRKKNGLITASRLAGEKHIDWLIKAVVEAKKTVQDLTLDIYGRGTEESKLRQLISELEADSYITLKGQHKLDDVYKQYATYISASTSEGFGLTLMEAVGSGLGMVGFDVPYGNQTFIEDDKNGYLIPYIKNEDEINIKELSNAIVKIQEKEMGNGGLAQVQKASYKIAEPFLTTQIRKKWLALEKEVCHD